MLNILNSCCSITNRATSVQARLTQRADTGVLTADGNGETPWRADTWQKFVDHAVSVTPPSAPADLAPNRNAVFIVGMPRSGTTLLEQMLGRHPRITGRGELNFLSEFAVQSAALGSLGPGQFREMGDVLWTQMRQQGPEDGLFIDKNPMNFRHLGLLFSLLPSAKSLCTRYWDPAMYDFRRRRG